VNFKGHIAATGSLLVDNISKNTAYRLINLKVCYYVVLDMKQLLLLLWKQRL